MPFLQAVPSLQLICNLFVFSFSPPFFFPSLLLLLLVHISFLLVHLAYEFISTCLCVFSFFFLFLFFSFFPEPKVTRISFVNSPVLCPSHSPSSPPYPFFLSPLSLSLSLCRHISLSLFCFGGFSPYIVYIFYISVHFFSFHQSHFILIFLL